MPLPAGVSTCTVTWGSLLTMFGGACTVTVQVTPVFGGNAKSITWAASGQGFLGFPETYPGAPGAGVSFTVPHVDQDGFINGLGHAVKMWSYVAVATVRSAGGDVVNLTKAFQPLVGQDTVDLDMVPDGSVTLPTSAPLASVLSVNGQTGHVTVAGELEGITVDTGEMFRVVLFGNGTLRAIPKTAPDPVAPTGLAADVRVAYVDLTWNAAATPAASYAVFRDGVQIGTTTSTKFRDSTVVPGHAAYSYTVKTVDAYTQRSPASDPASAFVDPALNVAPTVVVTSWPPAHFTDGKTLIRVCATDWDAQGLALELSVDAGSLQATDDPSIWYFIPAL